MMILLELIESAVKAHLEWAYKYNEGRLDEKQLSETITNLISSHVSDYSYCKSIKCLYYPPKCEGGCLRLDGGCQHNAKELYMWFIKNNYIIVKVK